MKRLWLWRAWSENRERICDCGDVWATSEGEAKQFAALCVGGPHAGKVAEIQVQPVSWPTAPHSRQIGAHHDPKVTH